MPTAKIRYEESGDADTPILEASDKLKAKLRAFYPDQRSQFDPDWAHPADTFVAILLVEVRWAIRERHRNRRGRTKPAIRNMHSSLLKRLRDIERDLRKLPPDLDRLLGGDADPVGCAEKINELVGSFERAAGHIDSLSSGKIGKRPVELDHATAMEMSIRVLQVLKRHGIAPAATDDGNGGSASDAVRILKLIGDDIGLRRSERTWRYIVSNAKELSRNLRNTEAPGKKGA